MNKLNVLKRDIQKERRNKRANKRRLKSIAGCLKVSLKPNTHTLLNRKQRKLQKKWRLVLSSCQNHNFEQFQSHAFQFHFLW
jgi:hypothetical protein